MLPPPGRRIRHIIAADADRRARDELWWMGFVASQLCFWVFIAFRHPEPWWATISAIAGCLVMFALSFRDYRRAKARARLAREPDVIRGMSMGGR